MFFLFSKKDEELSLIYFPNFFLYTGSYGSTFVASVTDLVHAVVRARSFKSKSTSTAAIADVYSLVTAATAGGIAYTGSIAHLLIELSACSTGSHDGPFPWDAAVEQLLWTCLAHAADDAAALQLYRPAIVAVVSVSGT
jgi:hypothetical protein